jgi:group I intron endonuclease
LLRNKRVGKKHLDSVKKRISESLKGENNPFFGKYHLLKTKKLMSLRKSKKQIYIYDNLLNLLVIFPSINQLAKSIKANNKTISNYIKKNVLFRGN